MYPFAFHRASERSGALLISCWPARPGPPPAFKSRPVNLNAPNRLLTKRNNEVPRFTMSQFVAVEILQEEAEW